MIETLGNAPAVRVWLPVELLASEAIEVSASHARDLVELRDDFADTIGHFILMIACVSARVTMAAVAGTRVLHHGLHQRIPRHSRALHPRRVPCDAGKCAHVAERLCTFLGVCTAFPREQEQYLLPHCPHLFARLAAHGLGEHGRRRLRYGATLAGKAGVVHATIRIEGERELHPIATERVPCFWMRIRTLDHATVARRGETAAGKSWGQGRQRL